MGVVGIVEGSLAASYRPGGSVAGRDAIVPFIVPWMKCIPMIKSVKSSAPRCFVSARFQIAPSFAYGNFDLRNTSLACSPLSTPFFGPTIAKMRVNRALSSLVRIDEDAKSVDKGTPAAL